MKYFKHIILVFLFMLIACDDRTNWNENYRKESKDPFGTYIIYNELENLFPQSKIKTLDQNIYDELTDYGTTIENTNYICIKNEAYKFNDEGIDKLIDFVANGNNAFLSLNYFSEILQSALEVKVYSDSPLLEKTEGYLYFNNKKLQTQTYFYNRNLHNNYFSKFNEQNTIVLGTEKIEGIMRPTFLKVYYGKGAFYLHSEPIAFTNYFMLKKNNSAYVANAFSYMKNAELTWWDAQNHYSNRTDNYENKEEEDHKNSVLSFFWENPSLKWSMLVAFFGLIGFLVFNARRKQRPIPEIKKLQNPTVEFTHTIANLYLVEDNPKNLVDKKTTYFLQYIRTNYMLDTNRLDEQFVKRLSEKSGNTIRSTRYLIKLITILSNKITCTQDQLIRLNKSIEKFLNQEKKS